MIYMFLSSSLTAVFTEFFVSCEPFLTLLVRDWQMISGKVFFLRESPFLMAVCLMQDDADADRGQPQTSLSISSPHAFKQQMVRVKLKNYNLLSWEIVVALVAYTLPETRWMWVYIFRMLILFTCTSYCGLRAEINPWLLESSQFKEDKEFRCQTAYEVFLPHNPTEKPRGRWHRRSTRPIFVVL